ncbi:hypothetical protein F5146DRAFT_731520 [Armillaria mellea]|nr:hypothetical protein F5146DRAFT_731520 [Armillaria mellea]
MENPSTDLEGRERSPGPDSKGISGTSNTSDASVPFLSWFEGNERMLKVASKSINLLNEPSIDTHAFDHSFDSYTDVSNIVLEGLDLLSGVHPAIGVAVVAFKLVVMIEAKRRENDKKVHVLRLHMRDLMIAIFQLRRFKDPKDVGPDDLTINDRIGDLMKKIAQDIRNTGSVCEFYLKKSTISRIMKSTHHQGVFSEHVAILVKDREDLDKTLQIHIGVGVDSANAKLDNQEAMLNSIDRKIENLSEKMEKLFRQLETSRERDVQMFIKDKGGVQNCIEHEDLLAQLIQKSGKGYDDILGPQFASNKSLSDTREKARKELRREWQEDVEKAFGKNMKNFEKKLELQGRELRRQGQQLQDIDEAMRMGHAQILNAMKSGAHDRIIDYDFKKLWEGMAWNRSVKAKHLVLALHDYFIEKLRPLGRPYDPIPAEYEKDQWTLAYLNSPHLQPLLEAIDDDATGFITIREINTFVESKPKEWTLLQWIAYWAEGWKISIHQHKYAIYTLISAMHKTFPRVLPANRHEVYAYLRHETIFQIDKLLQSTHDPPPNAYKSMELLRLSQEFGAIEGQRLQANLEAILYDIDAEYTVSLLTGPGRIERYIYPMLYLLLRRHYGVLELATKVVLHPEEISDMTASLWNLFAVVDRRLENLASIFKQSNIDVEEKLKNFAFGMFRLYYDSPEKDLSNNLIAKYICEQSIFDGNVEPPEVSPNDLVYDTPGLLSGASCYPHTTPFPANATEDPIQGQWAGHVYDAHGSRSGLIQLSIESSPEGTLTGEAVTWQFTMKISGNIMQNNQVKIRLDFDHFYSKVFIGQFDAKGCVIEGRQVEDALRRAEGSEEEGENDSLEETPRNAEENEDQDQVLKDVNGVVAASEDGEEEIVTQQDELGAIEAMHSSATDLKSPANDVDAASQGSDEIDDQFTFVFRRTPASLWRFLPSGPLDSPVARDAGSLARARWRFALKCVLDRIRRENSPGEYFVERFIEAGRFIVLARREIYGSQDYCPRLSDLSAEEEEELQWLKCAICPEFSGPYYALVTDAIDRKFSSYSCDSCEGGIVGSRLACFTCMNDSYMDTVDLCTSCVGESIQLRGFIHDASHVLLKCDTYVLDVHWWWIIPRARSMLVQIKKKLRSRSEPTESSNVLGNGPQSKKDASTMSESLKCQTCLEEVALPCWVRVDSYWTDSENCLCDKCESKSKPPANDSPEFGLPLLRLGIDDDKAPVEVVTVESRLAALEKKFDEHLSVLTKLLEKLTSNSLPNEGTSPGAGF